MSEKHTVRTGTLGTVRVRHEHTDQIILVPTPSQDPNDPLNWPFAFKCYVTGLLCLAVFMAHFVNAGPSVAIVSMTVDFFGPPGPDFLHNVGRIAYFFTGSSLVLGMINVFWSPFAARYGRRPVYVITFIIATAAAAWCAAAKSYGSELAARIFLSAGTGAAEILAPMTISDIFFVHQRGAAMVIYTFAVSSGIGGGIVLAGLITIKHDWRMIYWVNLALLGAVTILIILTLPETLYLRVNAGASSHQEQQTQQPGEELGDGKGGHSYTEDISRQLSSTPAHEIAKKTFIQRLSVFSGVYTHENFLKIMFRPFVLFCLPSVLWATLVWAVTIGFVISVNSNTSVAFQEAYGWDAWQSGLAYVALFIGSLLAIAFGGKLSDATVDFFVRRNKGVREPEMRLPAMVIPLVVGPLGLILYGLGVERQLHWMCPTMALGLLGFNIVTATNIALVYSVDCYRPVAPEVVVTEFAIKAAFGFLLSFYTTPWIEAVGHLKCFSTMGAIMGFVYLLAIPAYFFGKRLRTLTWRWGVTRRFVHWKLDREVGE